MHSEHKFKELYARLNPEQREAVDATEGPVMVIAGPGTGKTQILTLRIANILRKTDIHPSNILALTFTESAASSMRRRLADIIGSAAYAVHIRTFHGFCNEIIQDYPEEFPRIIGSTSMTDVEQIQMMTDIIDRLALEHLKPMGDPHYYVRLAVSAITALKQEGVSPEKFSSIVEDEKTRFEKISDLYHERGAYKGKMKGDYITLERQIAKQEELSKIYAEYQAACAVSRRYDFPDMIMEVLAALESMPSLLQLLQEQFQYILIDEHQDTNRAQNMVIELLASFHEHPNIFTVGDEKQAIFRFQGASLENFLYFKERYSGARSIILETNYRSSQAILDSAESLIPGAKPLRAGASHPHVPIRVAQLPTIDAEREFVIEKIEELRAEGAPLHEIAVLYRDNKDAQEMARMLGGRGIPYAVESDRNIMEDPEIKKIIALLKAVHSFGSEEQFLTALHVDFLGVVPLDVYILTAGAGRSNRSVFLIAKSLAKLRSLGIEAPESIHTFYKKLSGWVSAEKNGNFLDFFEKVARESGFLSHVLTLPDAIEKLEYFTVLFDHAKALVENQKNFRLADFIRHLETAATHRISVMHRLSYRAESRVRLMTAHKAKGLEFDHVFILHAYDTHWSNKRAGAQIKLPRQIYVRSNADAGKEDANDDERRLFYVALTRARKQVYITFPRIDGIGAELLACQFIMEIRPELIEKSRPEQVKRSTGKSFLLSEKEVGVGIKDKEVVRELFRERGLAVTALNNYLECPWKYFYTNLIRIPRPPEPHQMYGIAIHSALRDFFATLKNRDNTKEFLTQAFIRALTEQPIPERDFEKWKDRGITALSGYYDAYAGKWPRNVRTEFEIYGIALTPDVRLTGKIDKLEFIGEGNEVNVIDYKTGKPKSRGEIEGKTKTSRGDIKRQLVFYDLLLSKYENGRYAMQSGEIDFVEPDDKGRYKREIFTVTTEEIEALEKEILRVSGEIMDLKFWDVRCGEKSCEFCALRELMKSA